MFDGPISVELEDSVKKYVKKYQDWIKIVSYKENRGLGLALADGINACTYELIARMDTDDISRSDRFEKQLKMFQNDPQLDICGSHIVEFEGIPDNILSEQRVPLEHSQIAKYQKQRSAFNHMTVLLHMPATLVPLHLLARKHKDVPDDPPVGQTAADPADLLLTPAGAVQNTPHSIRSFIFFAEYIVLRNLIYWDFSSHTGISFYYPCFRN